MTVRPCLSCGRLGQATRCPACEAERQRARNARRPWYGGAWPRLRRAAIAAQPWCSRCGATDDLEVDHVEARSLDAGLRVLCAPCHRLVGDARGLEP